MSDSQPNYDGNSKNGSSIFLFYLMSDLNEITFFDDLLDYAVKSMDREQMKKTSEKLMKEEKEPLESILIYHLEKDDHNKIKRKLVITYLNTIFETYLFNLVKHLLLKHKSLLGIIEVNSEELISRSPSFLLNRKAEKVTQSVLQGNYTRIIRNIDKKLNLDLFGILNSDELEKLDDLKKTRNKIVHRKAKIELLPDTLQLSSEENSFLHEELDFYDEYVISARELIAKIALKIDKVFCKLNPELIYINKY